MLDAFETIIAAAVLAAEVVVDDVVLKVPTAWLWTISPPVLPETRIFKGMFCATAAVENTAAAAAINTISVVFLMPKAPLGYRETFSSNFAKTQSETRKV